VTPLTPGSASVTDLVWGGLSGVGTGGGMLFLYRGLSRGAMSVVVPLAAVGGLAVPVLVGVAVLGDRPTMLAVAGMAIVVPALWLTVPRGHGSGGGVTDGLVASVFIAVQYLALAMAEPTAGLWPVLAGRVTATLAVLPLAWRELSTGKIISHRKRRSQAATTSSRAPCALVGAAATGACATLALVAYLLATRTQLLSIAVVLSSLYPAIPVLLGLTVLRERLNLHQTIGLLGAAAATVLLTLADQPSRALTHEPATPGHARKTASNPPSPGASAARAAAARPPAGTAAARRRSGPPIPATHQPPRSPTSPHARPPSPPGPPPARTAARSDTP
jgi:drug/metabolite transporter (DMT)-like permease